MEISIFNRYCFFQLIALIIIMEQGHGHLSCCWKNDGQEDLTYFTSDYSVHTSLVSRNRIIHLKEKRFTQNSIH